VEALALLAAGALVPAAAILTPGRVDTLPGVEFAGCEEVLEGNRCLVSPRSRLVIWVPLPAEASLRTPAGVRREPGEGGVRLRVDAPDVRQPLVLDVQQGPQRWRWQLELIPSRPHPGLQAAIDKMKAGQLDAAAALLDDSWQSSNERQRALGLAVRADLALGRGQIDRWFSLREQAAEQAVRAGARTSAARNHMALAHGYLTRRHDLTAARRHIERVSDREATGIVAVWRDMQRGYLAQRSGELGQALDAFTTCARRAERLDQQRDAWLARRQQATMLGAIGRFQEAVPAFRRLAREADGRGPCERAGFLNSLAWQELIAREAGAAPAVAGPVQDTIDKLERALALYRACPTAAGQPRNVQVNLAFAHLQAGQVTAARRALAAARPQGPAPDVIVELWRLDLLGRAALAAREVGAALEAFGRLEELAARTLAGEAGWRAVVGRARALALGGRRAEAIAAYQRAESRLDEQVNQVPLGDGRSDLLAARDVATGELVAALMAAGRSAEAIETARRGRRRTVVGARPQDRLPALNPEQRRRWDEAVGAFLAARSRLEQLALQRWSLVGSQRDAARDEEAGLGGQARQHLAAALALLGPPEVRAPLPRPGPGEVILGFHPIARGFTGQTEWLGYAIDARSHQLARLGRLDPGTDQLGRRLLAPFGRRLAGARRVRVLGYGPLSEIDFHALPFRGEPLGTNRQVVYSLDLPPAPQRRPSGAADPTVLVVADPGGNLPEARREGDEVAGLLRRRHLPVIAAVGPQHRLSGPRMRPMLAGADLFHYAGHGRFAAPDGMGSELPLAEGTALAVADVLALPANAVPRQVVLAGCETGRVERQAGAGLGLAQAFVLAGSQEVLASARRVDDGVARALSTRLHRTDASELGEALRLARLTLSRELPARDWAAFRVIVR
jgi:tetratricopeptide (TPR) repeat protein